MNIVAYNLDRIIQEKGYKQGAVARKAGLTVQKMSNMMRGRAVIRAEQVPNLCHALGVEPNDLYREKEAESDAVGQG